MISHLFKLVWNRWRSNVLMVVEVFFCFVVVYVVAVATVYFGGLYAQPLGFSYDNVWRVSVDFRGVEPSAAQMQELRLRLLNVVRSTDVVEEAATATCLPYGQSTYVRSSSTQGRNVSAVINWADEKYDDVMRITPLSGRWFEKGDEDLHWKPMVINERLARHLFGNENPVGKKFPLASDGEPERRVIGVVRDYRQNGEFSGATHYYFEYIVTKDTNMQMYSELVFRVQPGTQADFSERLQKRLHAEYSQATYNIKPLSAMRVSSLQTTLVPLLIVVVIAVFLLLMAALGLIGVLWQNVSRRTREIGLRRAVGAGVRDIYAQILGEVFVLMSFALLLGTAVVMQVPLLGLLQEVALSTYVSGLLISLAVMYVLALACGLYPAVLAVRIQPTEALHYE